MANKIIYGKTAKTTFRWPIKLITSGLFFLLFLLLISTSESGWLERLREIIVSEELQQVFYEFG